MPTALPKKSAALLWQDNDMLIAKQKSNLVCWVYFYWHNPYQRHIYLEVWANPKRIAKKYSPVFEIIELLHGIKNITLRLFKIIETKFWDFDLKKNCYSGMINLYLKNEGYPLYNKRFLCYDVLNFAFFPLQPSSFLWLVQSFRWMWYQRMLSILVSRVRDHPP